MSAPVVTVRGEATLEIEPDLATLSVSVAASGSSVERVTTDLAAGSEQLAAVTERFRDAIERSSTSGLNVHPVTDRRNATKITGFRGSFSSQVVVADFGRLSDLVLAFGAVPQLQLAGPSWSLRRDNPAYRDVRLAAITDGRRRADDYAAAFHARIQDLVEISDLDTGGAAPMLRGAAFAAPAGAADVSFDFEPKPQTVAGAVTLRFTMTSPVLDN
jgi:uncharacterized protein